MISCQASPVALLQTGRAEGELIQPPPHYRPGGASTLQYYCAQLTKLIRWKVVSRWRDYIYIRNLNYQPADMKKKGERTFPSITGGVKETEQAQVG